MLIFLELSLASNHPIQLLTTVGGDVATTTFLVPGAETPVDTDGVGKVVANPVAAAITSAPPVATIVDGALATPAVDVDDDTVMIILRLLL